MEKQFCPLCNCEVRHIPRYPDYICSTCAENPLDEDGKPLRFYNIAVSGGFKATYIDSGEVRDSHICYVAGKKCFADEARFGGIVIELMDDKNV